MKRTNLYATKFPLNHFRVSFVLCWSFADASEILLLVVSAIMSDSALGVSLTIDTVNGGICKRGSRNIPREIPSGSPAVCEAIPSSTELDWVLSVLFSF